MFHPNRITITRRSALRTTTLTAIGVAFMSAAGARPTRGRREACRGGRAAARRVESLLLNELRADTPERAGIAPGGSTSMTWRPPPTRDTP